MKTSLAACAFMAATAAAFPFVHNAQKHHHHAQKRDVDIVTVIDTVVETKIAYATAYVYPNGQPVPSAANVHAAAHTHHPAATKVAPKPVHTPAPPPVKSAPVQSIPKASAQAPPVETHAPALAPESAPAPAHSAPAPVHSAPAPVHPPPAPAHPAPAPAPPAPVPGPSSGKQFTGDMTYYATGQGSCGYTSSDSEAVVAIPHGQMNNGANPNNNPLCGKTVTINYRGKTKTAKIVDTCEGCADGALDMSDSLFQYFAPLSLGRGHGMKWSID